MPQGKGTYGSKKGRPKKKQVWHKQATSDAEYIANFKKDFSEGKFGNMTRSEARKANEAKNLRRGETEFIPGRLPKVKTNLKGTALDETVAPIVAGIKEGTENLVDHVSYKTSGVRSRVKRGVSNLKQKASDIYSMFDKPRDGKNNYSE